MPRYAGRNTSLYIGPSDGGCPVAISGRSNTATLSFTSAEVDVTSFGAAWRERIADAIKDWTIEMGGFWDSAACQLDATLFPLMAACTSVCFGPSGSESGMVQYTGCAILQDYTIESAVDGAVTFSCAFMAASVLNRTTWA